MPGEELSPFVNDSAPPVRGVFHHDTAVAFGVDMSEGGALVAREKRPCGGTSIITALLCCDWRSEGGWTISGKAFVRYRVQGQWDVVQCPEASSLDRGSGDEVGRENKSAIEDEIADGRKGQVPKEISYCLNPASARRPRRPSREPDDSMNFYIGCFLPEISLSFEAPVEKAGDPVLQAFDINGDEGI